MLLPFPNRYICYIRNVFLLFAEKLDKFKEKALISLPRANTQTAAVRNIGPIMNETYALLQKFYQPHNEELVKLLNRTDFNWSDDTLDWKWKGTKEILWILQVWIHIIWKNDKLRGFFAFHPPDFGIFLTILFKHL